MDKDTLYLTIIINLFQHVNGVLQQVVSPHSDGQSVRYSASPVPGQLRGIKQLLNEMSEPDADMKMSTYLTHTHTQLASG